jgi:hypothetical protein
MAITNPLLRKDSLHFTHNPLCLPLQSLIRAYGSLIATSDRKTTQENFATVSSNEAQCDRQADRHDHILLRNFPGLSKGLMNLGISNTLSQYARSKK